MHPTSPELPALISSRICHDLASPLMAIANGLELLEMTGLGETPETALLSDSVKAARARMEFFRIAFGAGDAAELNARKCATALDDNYAERKIDVTWDVVGDVSRASVKLAFLLVLCCETAMPRGGKVSVSRDGGGWTVSATADRFKEIEPLWKTLTDGGGEVGASDVHFVLAHATASAGGLALTVEQTETTLVLQAN